MSEKEVKTDPYIMSWHTAEGFCTLFYRMCGEYSTQEKAYERAEEQFIAQFGVRRYSSFQSFKNCRNNKLKNRTIEK